MAWLCLFSCVKDGPKCAIAEDILKLEIYNDFVQVYNTLVSLFKIKFL